MISNYSNKFLLVVLTFLVQGLVAQDFMMQGYYWDYPKTTEGYNWADTLIGHAEEINDAGITFLSLPPLARTNSGNSSNGYDPKDLFDYGEFGGGATGFGTRIDIDDLIDTLGYYSIKAVGDLVLNHRDGGEYENNSALESYNGSFDYPSGDQPYPYDRYRVILPIGGSTGNGAGDYYFKVTSRSGHADFHGAQYSFYVVTNKIGDQGTSTDEGEPNGGGDCDPVQPSKNMSLGDTVNCTNSDWSGCWVDEFKLTLASSDFNSGGDTIFITFGKRNSGYSDMYIYGLYSSFTGTDIVSQLDYQTATDFSDMPSERGEMDYSYFKPNAARPSDLFGTEDGMLFYLDYDQYQQKTYDTLFNWAEWNWNNVGIRGFRMDAVKHYPPEFVGNLLDYLHDESIDPTMAVGEFFSASTSELRGWVNDVYSSMEPDTESAITPRVYDFSLRDNLRQACDANTGYDVRNIFVSGVHDAAGTSMSGNNVITFVNNHDFRDESGFTSLIHNNPMLAYAYILTNNQVGLPTIFYPDYFGYHGSETYFPTGDAAAPHGDEMKKLIEIHKKYIFGSTSIFKLNQDLSGSLAYNNTLGTDNNKVLVYQLAGAASGKDVIVAINFKDDVVQFNQEVELSSGNLSFNDTLIDLMGGSAHKYAIVKNEGVNNSIWIDLPSRSYAVWVQGDTNDVIPLRPQDLVIDSINETRVVLSWADNSNNESGFKVYATPDGGSATLLTTTLSDAETFTYTGLTQDKEYTFEVIATNTAGDSESAKEVKGRTWVKWTGDTDRDWAKGGNWGSGNPISSLSKIMIPNVTNNPQISSAEVCDRMLIQNGGKLEITATHSLTISNKLINNAGNSGLLINSSSAGTATLINSTNNVDASVNTFFTNSNDALWTLVAPPVDNETANVFLGEYLDLWNEPTEQWVDITDETTPINLMQGYSSRKVVDTAKYQGKLRAGEISHSLDYTIGAPDAYTGWNLLGNPYPSNIDWDLVTIPTNMSTGISIWDSDGGTYFQYSKVGGGNVEARYLQVGQGFFSRATTTGVSLTFNDSMRTHSGTGGIDKKESNRSTIFLNTLVFNVEKDGKKDNTYINFREEASWNYDIETDVQKLFGLSSVPQIFSYINMEAEELAAINSIPFPTKEDTLHLGFRVDVPGEYQMNISGAYHLNANMTVLLYDKVSTDIVDIKKDSTISFDYLNSDPENRFDLLFNYSTSLENTPITKKALWNIYSVGNTLYIQSEITKSAKVRIYNMQGQQILPSTDVTFFSSGKSIPLQQGYYLVSVISKETIQNEKVLVIQ